MNKVLIFLLGLLFLTGCSVAPADDGNIRDSNGNSIINDVTGALKVENDMQVTSYVPIYTFLDTNGDHTGSLNANGDYSITEQDFYIKPEFNKTFYLSRMLISIEDSGSFDSGDYGNGITLTEGVTIWFEREGVRYNLTNSQPIMTNGEWGAFSFDIALETFGSGNQFLNIRLTFEKAGQPIILHGYHNDSFGITLNDDFTGLISHRFQVQGFEVNN